MGQIIHLLINLITGSCLLISGVYFISVLAHSAFKRDIPVLLEKVGKSPVKTFFISAGITAVIQSSTAISVLTVSFADSGALSLASAMASIYGANLGTCVTAQIMSFNIIDYSFHILLLGAGLWFISACFKPLKLPAEIIMAAGFMFAGLMILSLSVPLIKNSSLIMGLIDNYGDSKLYLIFFGFLATALANSSSATVGLTMTLFSGGIIDFNQAAYIVMGDNIGTCVTAQIAAYGAGVNGKRIALGHILYNILGTLAVCAFADFFISSVYFFTNLLRQPDYYLVANAHLLFNIASALVFMPVNKYFCAALTRLYPNEVKV